MSNIKEINLDEHLDEKTSALIGRENGKIFLKSLEKKGINIEDGDEITISIPDRIITINSSYFQGFFGQAVRNCGRVESFFDKYKFEASEYIKIKIKKYAQATMLDAPADEILKAK